MYDNINFFVDRKGREYLQAGRNEPEDEAIEIDKHILTMLQFYEYNTVSTFDEVLNHLNLKDNK